MAFSAKLSYTHTHTYISRVTDTDSKYTWSTHSFSPVFRAFPSQRQLRGTRSLPRSVVSSRRYRRATFRGDNWRIGSTSWIISGERIGLTIDSERHPLANRRRHVVAGDAEIRPHLPPLDTVEMQQRAVVVVVLLESATTCVHGTTHFTSLYVLLERK